MKKFFITFMGLFLVIGSHGQSKPLHEEIDFVGGTIAKVLKRASTENKLVFIDCYTSWCGPCKWMEKNVFNNKETANFYNANFINYKIDMEKGEGPEFRKTQNVHSYPTYLFLNGKGELVHMAMSKMNVENFIQEGKNAINPKQALGIMAEKYQQNKLNNDELSDYAVALNKRRDSKSKEVFAKLIATANASWFDTLSGWKLIESFIADDTPELLRNLEKYNKHYIAMVGKEKVNAVYRRLLLYKMYKSSKDQDAVVFFKQLDSLKELGSSPRDIAIIVCQYHLDGKDASKFITASNYYVDNVLKKDYETIVYLARLGLFKGKDNPEILRQSAQLTRKAYDINPNDYGTVSTFAQIQNIVGNKEEAIKAAELAVKMADTISSKVKSRAEKDLKEIRDKK